MKPKNVKQAMLRFQFLLVRLKVHRACIRACIRAISIPTGTIKSSMPKKRHLNIHTFQFLLVRLKVVLPSGSLPPCSISIPTGTIKRKKKIMKKITRNFNSYWYGEIFKSNKQGFTYFNSHWYD